MRTADDHWRLQADDRAGPSARVMSAWSAHPVRECLRRNVQPGILHAREGGEAPGCEQLDPTSGAFDGIIDFERVLGDPARPSAINAACDSGDHLHPNDAGYKAMGESIDLKLFSDRSAGNSVSQTVPAPKSRAPFDPDLRLPPLIFRWNFCRRTRFQLKKTGPRSPIGIHCCRKPARRRPARLTEDGM